MTLEEMRIRKRALGMTNAQLARLAGIPLSTVQKILGGSTASPRYRTMQALEAVLGRGREYLENMPDIPRRTGPFGYGETAADSAGSILCEEVPVYQTGSGDEVRKKAGSHLTIADRDALPDYPLTELIDGVIYDLGSPRTVHQLIAGDIHAQLLAHVRAAGGSCIPFIGPTDVVIDDDDDSVLVPDVFVVCDRDKIKELKVYGAPDLVIEVLSPSTKKKDQTVKLCKYYDAGVREYWLVDPVKRTVLVYDMDAMRDESLTGRAETTIYGFEEQIPVRIWGGVFCVDMKSLSDYLASAGM